MAQQPIIIYLAFGTAALCLLIILIRVISGGKRVLVKNVTGPVNTGDAKGNITLTYTSVGPKEGPAKPGRDWLDRTNLVLFFITVALALFGAVMTFLTYLRGTP